MHNRVLTIGALLLLVCHHLPVHAAERTGGPPDVVQALEHLRQSLAINPYDGQALPQIRLGTDRLEAGEPRAYYRALTYLGAMAQRDMASARTDYLHLIREEPASPLIERLAPERLEQNCQGCRGRGKISVICTVCHGNRVCPTCKGAKTMAGLSVKRACPTCRGTGKCAHCGKDGKNFQPCPKCRGGGKEFDLNEILTLYKRMLQTDLQAVEEGRWRRFFRDPAKRTEAESVGEKTSP